MNHRYTAFCFWGCIRGLLDIFQTSAIAIVLSTFININSKLYDWCMPNSLTNPRLFVACGCRVGIPVKLCGASRSRAVGTWFPPPWSCQCSSPWPACSSETPAQASGKSPSPNTHTHTHIRVIYTFTH